jgi:predicted TIM-barrel fold metal-dependent hydrolase
MTHYPVPALGDPEGERLPDGLPPVIDAHVHLFPDRLFQAIWDWFDRHGWPIRYRLKTPAAIDFLISRGVRQIVALQYAHKPGIARAMNRYLAQVCRDRREVTGLATVFPGEEGAREILEEALGDGLRGVKLHCHVQCIAPDAPALAPIFELCAERGVPIVMHAGREPRMPALKCDPHQLCAAERVERVLRDHPRLTLCVPHLGCDEYSEYARMLERYEHLWLDTTMMLGGFPGSSQPSPEELIRFLEIRPDRILYGTDFPNLPYAWDREIRTLLTYALAPDKLERLLSTNARALHRLG